MIRQALARTGQVPIMIALVLVAGLAAPCSAERATAQTGASSGTDMPIVTAPVIVDGVELFRVRGASGYAAEQRARDIAHRIVMVARDGTIDPASVRIEGSEGGPRVTAGDGALTIVTAVASEAQREALSQPELAAIYQRQVAAAVETYRRLRDPRSLLRNAGWGLAATLFAVALVVAGRWLFRRIDRAIARRADGAVARLRIQSVRLLSREQTWGVMRWLLRTLRAVAMLALLYGYLDFVLSRFPWTRGAAIRMLDLVLDPLLTMARAVLGWMPDLVFLLVLVFVTRLLLRVIRLLFSEVARGTVKFEKFDPEWAMPTYRLVRILVVAFAVVVAFPYIPGSSSDAFKGVSLFVGVLFSLGSSSVIGNVIAGYTMTYRRAFRQGDRVRIGDVVGDVTTSRLLVTNLRTVKNEEVVIPNSVILSSSVVNYSTYARAGGLVLHTTVGIGYEVPWRQVEAMLLMAADRTDGLLREPPPFVLQTGLGDFAVTYELNVHCASPERMTSLYSALHSNILDVFNEYGVQIMTPAYEGDTLQPKIVARGRWYAAPARAPGDEPAVASVESQQDLLQADGAWEGPEQTESAG